MEQLCKAFHNYKALSYSLMKAWKKMVLQIRQGSEVQHDLAVEPARTQRREAKRKIGFSIAFLSGCFGL